MLEELFTAFRNGDAPTQYAENRTAVSADILEAGLIFCTIVIATAYLLVLPGIRGRKRIYGAVRGLLAIYIGAMILIANFGQEWEVSAIHTKTEYKAGTNKDIEAEVGVKIGLRSVNITLKGTPEKQLHEQINYNERFSWAPSWDQGRIFYGPSAGQVNQEFRTAQYRGLPYPILWIAEYFTIDGENLRWGRSFRMSGYYAHIMLWTAFPTWIIANILLFMVFSYAAYCMILTGILLLLANFLYLILRWGPVLVIPFADGVLTFKFGWCYWITFATGCICLIYGFAVLVCNKLWPEKVAEFFLDYDKPIRRREKQRRRQEEIDADLCWGTTTVEMGILNQEETDSLGYQSRPSTSPSLHSGIQSIFGSQMHIESVDQLTNSTTAGLNDSRNIQVTPGHPRSIQVTPVRQDIPDHQDHDISTI